MPSDSPDRDRKGRILVVDDDEDFRELLRFELTMVGYEVLQADSGKSGLAMLEAEPVDLALVDLFLPDLNGYEICSKVKSDPVLRWMPVILITSLKDPKALAKGIDNGADEFIAKPFEKAELLARVRSQLRASQLRKALQKSLRECAHLQNVKDQLYRLVIHDLRGPVTAVMGALELLGTEIQEGDKDRSMWLLKKAGRACENILEMVETLVDIEKMEKGELTFLRTPMKTGAFLRDLVEQWLPLAQTKKVSLSLDGESDLALVGDPTYIKRAVGNLITNAIRHTPESSAVVIGAKGEGDEVEFWVQDQGQGISPEEAELVFDPVFQAEHRERRREGSYGLGLTLVRLVAEGHGGRAGAQSKPSRFYFRVRKEPR
jgi:signal transduction histidine kinase